MVNASERVKLRQPIIKQLMEDYDLQIDHIEFIPGGKTNESYLVLGEDGKKYFVRIAGEGTEKYIDRNKEIYNIIVADKIGVAPKLIHTKDSNLLLEYIDATCTNNQEILYFDNNIDKLTKQLRVLHNTQEKFKGTFSFIHTFELYKKDFLSTGCSKPDEIKKNETSLYDMVKWVDDHLSNDVCPVHSDVVIQNVLFAKERAYIVDWEYSTMADRYLDLASFCSQNILAPGAEQMFLNSYFAGSSSEPDRSKLVLFKMSISFMWLYWYLNNIAHNKDLEYNEYRWRMHLNNALMCKEEWERLQRTPSL